MNKYQPNLLLLYKFETFVIDNFSLNNIAFDLGDSCMMVSFHDNSLSL